MLIDFCYLDRPAASVSVNVDGYGAAVGGILSGISWPSGDQSGPGPGAGNDGT